MAMQVLTVRVPIIHDLVSQRRSQSIEKIERGDTHLAEGTTGTYGSALLARFSFPR
jgi:hypothetical protein